MAAAQPSLPMVLIILLILSGLSLQIDARSNTVPMEFPQQPNVSTAVISCSSSALNHYYVSSSSPIKNLCWGAGLRDNGYRRYRAINVTITLPWNFPQLAPEICDMRPCDGALVYQRPFDMNVSYDPHARLYSLNGTCELSPIIQAVLRVYHMMQLLEPHHLFHRIIENSVPYAYGLPSIRSPSGTGSVARHRRVMDDALAPMKGKKTRRHRLISFFFFAAALRGRCCALRRVVSRAVQATDLSPSVPRRYDYGELAAATHGFDEDHRVGRGGFGPVYRGYLSDQKLHVAVKMLSQGQGSSSQGAKQYEAEVKILTRVRHRNIVQLHGWCDGPKGLFLVYEFISNASLDRHLHDPHSLLTWSHRYKIALGVGSAIQYLHTECEQCVVHGDIKPANIMLDLSWNAKLGDFGLARFLDHLADSQTTQDVGGTIGYMDPEFIHSRRPSAESDVYSFGVVLLEIASGRRPATATVRSDEASAPLLSWARGMYRRGFVLGAADRRLDGEFDERQMRRVLVVGLWCSHRDRSRRPPIAQAMDVLRREDAELPLLELPMEPVRLVEGIAYGDFSGQDSASLDVGNETAYHTSMDLAWNCRYT
ncbi:hypothetical protein ACP4OV_027884 [Aristida adscensionis]